jgi:phage gp36-like protein
MAYITMEDLEMRLPAERLVALTDDDGIGTINQPIIDHAISTASSEIDGYIGTRYKVPLAAAHPIITKLCEEITIYYLHLRLDRVSDDLQRAYDNAVRLLRDISRGMVSLGVESEPEATGHKRVYVSAPDRMFGPDELELMP